MPNKDEKPLYKRPVSIATIIAAIIVAIGAIIAAYIGIIPSMGTEVATVQGIVTDNNGKPVIGAVVKIDGSSDTTGSDGGYVIHSVPLNTKTITVNAPGVEVVKRAVRIPKGDEIIKYDINLPQPVTPTPTQTPTPTSTPKPVEKIVEITSPKDGDSVQYGNEVRGTASNVPDNLYLWVVDVNLDNRIYYPNGWVHILKDKWDTKTWLGDGSPEESGKKFYIQAVLADEQANIKFRDYMDTREAKGYPGMSELPEGAKVYDQIIVTRE